MSNDANQKLDDEDVSALKEMATWWRESNMTRRAALGLATGAGAAAAGAGGFMTGRASADASTSDGDGDVGKPDDRVDVFADGVDAISLGVENASVGSVDGHGGIFRLLDREEIDTDTQTVQFDGLNSNSVYRIFYSARVSTSGSDVYLRCNGDGDATGNYSYWDETGTRQSGEGEFLLATLSDNYILSGIVTVVNGDWTTDDREGINHQLLGGGPVGRVTTFGREGSRDDNDALSSIELIADDDFGGSQSGFELWGRDYS